MRIPMVDLERLDDELKVIVQKWQALGGDPNFIRTFGRLPDTLKSFLKFYSPLVRKGLIEREKAALRYADQMYIDHHKINDGLFSQLRTRFSDDEILELSWVIGEFISVGKIIHVLGVPYGEHE